MPRAEPPALRRSSRSARACGAALAALLKGSGAVWPCGTITGASTCPTPSSRSLPFWASQARPPSCGHLREMAAPSASSAHSRRTCSGCAPSTPSRNSVRPCWSFGRAITQPGSSNGTGSRHLRPCGRTSFHPRYWPRSMQSGVSVSVRKPDLEIIGFLSRRRRHLERSPSGTRLCSQPENANFLSETFPDRHLERAGLTHELGSCSRSNDPSHLYPIWEVLLTHKHASVA